MLGRNNILLCIVMLYGINYIKLCSSILTAQMCFNELHFKNLDIYLFNVNVWGRISCLHCMQRGMFTLHAERNVYIACREECNFMCSLYAVT